MKTRHHILILAAALCGLSAAQAQTPAARDSAANPSQTTTEQESRRGVPGVDVNRSGRDRGVPGVDMSAGRDGDQRNVDTRRAGAGPARAARADRN